VELVRVPPWWESGTSTAASQQVLTAASAAQVGLAIVRDFGVSETCERQFLNTMRLIPLTSASPAAPAGSAPAPTGGNPRVGRQTSPESAVCQAHILPAIVERLGGPHFAVVVSDSRLGMQFDGDGTYTVSAASELALDLPAVAFELAICLFSPVGNDPELAQGFQHIGVVERGIRVIGVIAKNLATGN
jgi:hypothetical protein